MDTVHKEAWSVGDVGCWLHELGLGQYAEAFAAQIINGRALEQLSPSDLDGLGMTVGHKHHLMAEVWRHNPARGSVLPESLTRVMMMEDMEAALAEVADIPPDFGLLDNTVYKDSANREVIVPAYLTLGVHALRGMNTETCEFGCDFGFQLRLKTSGLPRAALDHICSHLKFMINNQVHGAGSRDMALDAENSTTQVSIAGHFRGDSLMMFAGESETNFEMWRAFPFDRPSIILRVELLPVHLPHPVRERPWVVYFQMHETEHPASMVTFGSGADQMPSFDVARSQTDVHLLPSAPLSFTGGEDVDAGGDGDDGDRSADELDSETHGSVVSALGNGDGGSFELTCLPTVGSGPTLSKTGSSAASSRSSLSSTHSAGFSRVGSDGGGEALYDSFPARPFGSLATQLQTGGGGDGSGKRQASSFAFAANPMGHGAAAAAAAVAGSSPPPAHSKAAALPPPLALPRGPPPPLPPPPSMHKAAAPFSDDAAVMARSPAFVKRRASLVAQAENKAVARRQSSQGKDVQQQAEAAAQQLSFPQPASAAPSEAAVTSAQVAAAVNASAKATPAPAADASAASPVLTATNNPMLSPVQAPAPRARFATEENATRLRGDSVLDSGVLNPLDRNGPQAVRKTIGTRQATAAALLRRRSERLNSASGEAGTRESGGGHRGMSLWAPRSSSVDQKSGAVAADAAVDAEAWAEEEAMAYGQSCHTPVVRVTIKLYREPNSLIFNGFFPMLIVNCGTVLVAIPQVLDAGTFTQNLENSLTVMLALFAFLIFLREQLPPIPESTWVDNAVATSVVMILIAMVGMTASWCLADDRPEAVTFYSDPLDDALDDGEAPRELFGLFSRGTLRRALSGLCFFLVIGLQCLLVLSACIQMALYRQRVASDRAMGVAIRAHVERHFQRASWTQRKRLPSKDQTESSRALCAWLGRIDWLRLSEAALIDRPTWCFGGGGHKAEEAALLTGGNGTGKPSFRADL